MVPPLLILFGNCIPLNALLLLKRPDLFSQQGFDFTGFSMATHLFLRKQQIAIHFKIKYTTG